ncbi:MAG: hypothetical protein ABL955_12760, partial [Elusimicrobiota bacterium]
MKRIAAIAVAMSLPSASLAQMKAVLPVSPSHISLPFQSVGTNMIAPAILLSPAALSVPTLQSVPSIAPAPAVAVPVNASRDGLAAEI